MLQATETNLFPFHKIVQSSWCQRCNFSADHGDPTSDAVPSQWITWGWRRWRYGIFGPSTPFSPEVDFMGVLPSKHAAKPKDSFKELWKFPGVPVNFSNDPGKKCSRHQHQLNFRTQCMIPFIKAYGSIKPSTAPGVATKQWQPLAKSRPWSPWQFVGIFVWKPMRSSSSRRWRLNFQCQSLLTQHVLDKTLTGMQKTLKLYIVSPFILRLLEAKIAD